MVSNEGKITTFGTTGTLGGLVDATDKLHSGILKTLWNVSNGSRVVSSGTFTQSSNRFTLAGTVVYRSLGTKYTLAGNNYADVTAGDATYDRYDLIYIDRSADALAIAAGTAAASSRVADIAPEDVPVAIVKVVAGAAATATHSFQMLLSTFDKDVLSDDEVTYAKIQNVVNDERILGRVSGANGVIEELTQAQVLTFLGGVEAGADVTDATNVDAAGAVMHTDIPDSDTGFVKRTGAETYDIDTNTYLTAEADTLDTVTGRGATTSTGIQNNGYSYFQPLAPAASAAALAGPSIATFSYFYVNASTNVHAGQVGQVIVIKNIHTGQITLTSTTTFDGGAANYTEQRYTQPTTITLETLESVTLQYVDDNVAAVTGWYILSLDTDVPTGISNVVEDTSPQLGGNLDTNSNDITGDFALTGAVQMKKAVISTGNVSPAASAADSGKYFYRASSETANFTLPADTYVGEQYVLMNNSGSSITIASTGGDTIVGSTSVPHESAVTIIAVAANTWFVVG